MTREQLIAQAERLGIPRPRVLTAPELIDEIIGRTTKNDRERAKARGWLGRARDLLASVVERGLHLPEAARVLRKDGDKGWPAPPPPLPTVTLAEIYAAQGHLERAIAVLDDVIAREPDHREAHTMRARFVEQHHRSRARHGKDPEHAAPPDSPAVTMGDPQRVPQTPPEPSPEPSPAPTPEPSPEPSPAPTQTEAAPAADGDVEEAPNTTVSAGLQTGPVVVVPAPEEVPEPAPALEETPGPIAASPEAPVVEVVAEAAPPIPPAPSEPDLELANTQPAPQLSPPAPAEAAPAEPLAPVEAAAPEVSSPVVPEETPEPVVATEDAPAPAAVALPEEPPLPERYEVDEIVAIAVDPRTLYFYWEVLPTTLAHARAEHPDGSLCVRVASVVATWEGPLVDTRDLRVDGLHGDRFLRDVQPGSNLRVSVGWSSAAGFEPFAVGAEVTAPRAVPVETVAQEMARWEAEPVVAPFQNRNADALPAGPSEQALGRAGLAGRPGDGPMPRHVSPFESPSTSLERAWSHARGFAGPVDTGVARWTDAEEALEAVLPIEGTPPHGEEYDDDPVLEDLAGWSEGPGGSSELGRGGPAQRLRPVRRRRFLGGLPGRPGRAGAWPAWAPSGAFGGASDLSPGGASDLSR